MSDSSEPKEAELPSAVADVDQAQRSSQSRKHVENSAIDMSKRHAWRWDLSTFPNLAVLLLDVGILALLAISFISTPFIVLSLLTIASAVPTVLIVILHRITRERELSNTLSNSDLRWIEDRQLRCMIRSLSVQHTLVREALTAGPEVPDHE
jgi:hypothetical protein